MYRTNVLIESSAKKFMIFPFFNSFVSFERGRRFLVGFGLSFRPGLKSFAQYFFCLFFIFIFRSVCVCNPALVGPLSQRIAGVVVFCHETEIA